jgi:hypothetical protein
MEYLYGFPGRLTGFRRPFIYSNGSIIIFRNLNVLLVGQTKKLQTNPIIRIR